MAYPSLVEVDSIEIVVLVNDEIDYISPSPNAHVKHTQSFRGAPVDVLPDPAARGGAKVEFPMRNLCCGALGLSLLITVTKDEKSHSLLFDSGPEGDIFERNAKRLRLDMSKVEVMTLSHWHRDHSGGMVSAIKLVNEGKANGDRVTVIVPPNRPTHRGNNGGPHILSLEADPTLEELENAGGKVETNTQPQTVLDNMFLISSEIPRQTDYELGVRGGIRYEPKTNTWEKDELIMNKRFIMCKIKDKGLVVFTGCSHAGLINVARHAKELDNSPIHAIVGGYHLADAAPEKMKKSIEDLKALKPTVLMPGHCTGWRFKGLIEKEMPGQMAPVFGGTKYYI